MYHYFILVANSVRDYEDLLADSFANYLKLSDSVSPIVKEQSELVNKAITAQRQYIELASASQKPTDAQVAQLLKPTSELIAKIQVCCLLATQRSSR